MANPPGSMVPPGPSMAGQVMVPGSSGQMHPRAPRPPSQSGKENHSSYHPASWSTSNSTRSVECFYVFRKILEVSDVSLRLLRFRHGCQLGISPKLF